jgi:hypothetical protein
MNLMVVAATYLHFDVKRHFYLCLLIYYWLLLLHLSQHQTDYQINALEQLTMHALRFQHQNNIT